MSEQPDFIKRYGVAKNDLSILDKVKLANWKPITVPPLHPYDEKIAELEAIEKQKKKDAEFRALTDFESRQLHTLKNRRNEDFEKQDARADREKLLATVAEPLAKLRALREKLVASPDRLASEIVRVDQAIAQYLEVANGVGREYGDKLWEGIRQHEAELVAVKKKSLLDQRLTLEAELAKLDAQIEDKPAPEAAPKIQVAAGEDRAEAVLRHLKETANTVRLIDFFESEGSPEARQKIVDEFSEVAEAESTVVVEGDSAE